MFHLPFKTLALAIGGAALALGSFSASAEARPQKRMVKVCRHSSGTAGLIAGGAGGAVAGHEVLGGPIGTIAGAVGGAFAGRAVDRSMTAQKRCRYVRR
jgi:uncharacterized protein YcfJ